MESVLTVIHARRSVRSFEKKAVSREALEQLVRAAMAAPSAVNRQPWAFVAIDARETLDALGQRLPYANMLKRAPAAIVVCGDLSRTPAGREEAFWVQDCSAATQNILLAAEALNLGAVWTAVYPAPERVQLVRDLLALPPHIVPLNVIPLGHPAGKEKALDKWDPTRLIWNRWPVRVTGDQPAP